MFRPANRNVHQMGHIRQLKYYYYISANNENSSNKSQLGQDEAIKAEKRKQGETHLLQLRKGAASNKPIFTSIFGSPSSHQSNRYIIYFLLEIISIINLGLSLPYDICYHIF